MTIAEETVRNNGLKLSFCHLFCNFENFLHVPIWVFPPTRFPEVIVLDMTLPVIREERYVIRERLFQEIVSVTVQLNPNEKYFQKQLLTNVLQNRHS